MSLLTLEALKAGLPVQHKDVPIEGAGNIRLREFTGAGRAEAGAFFLPEERKANPAMYYAGYQRLVIRLACCNEDFTPLFPSGTPEQIEEAERVIGGLPASVLETLFNEATALNGLSKESKDEAVKNSEAGQTSTSGTALPATSDAA